MSVVKPPMGAGHGHGDEIWTPAEVCAKLKINMNQLYKLNASSKIPVYRVGKHCRYLRSEVLTWFKKQDVDRDPNASDDIEPEDLPDV